MKTRHKFKGWRGKIINVDSQSGDFLILWDDKITAWKHSKYVKDNLIFIIPAPTRRINNA